MADEKIGPTAAAVPIGVIGKDQGLSAMIQVGCVGCNSLQGPMLLYTKSGILLVDPVLGFVVASAMAPTACETV